MKFAFILDTSPLMQIKKSVIGEFQNRVPTSDVLMKEHAEQSKSEESKVINPPAGATQASTGMSFFEQSIFAIEEFIAVRKKIGFYKQDKYFLALTASNPESNCAMQGLGDQ